ncbi:hypothetical protein HanXRQr2_Chr04g0161501 [Helianthus annuus]|uniref:Uncharacterized protein n=1 Tax=Helianthus annuus TaxID=4232 RepID=A0A251V0E0_HELAN|nr:hypothetical protein HanXRQr2_Chr04g0161501 [Helianthus annuus]KAJ0588430.1 hypothetical protein HanIR_Chr04g0174571 [Helianthus annuus]KAJ0930950.1 hypothetical protein HanPSC8_Chr04g0155601 [Helianthus annuus]
MFPCLCRNGGVAYYWWCGAAVVTRGIFGVRWCRIQCAVPVVTELGCGSGGDGIRVRFRW